MLILHWIVYFINLYSTLIVLCFPVWHMFKESLVNINSTATIVCWKLSECYNVLCWKHAGNFLQKNYIGLWFSSVPETSCKRINGFTVCVPETSCKGLMVSHGNSCKSLLQCVCQKLPAKDWFYSVCARNFLQRF